MLVPRWHFIMLAINIWWIKHSSLRNSYWRTCFVLVHRVYEDDFRPEFIIVIWSDGASVDIAVQEVFEYEDIETDLISVQKSVHYGIN